MYYSVRVPEQQSVSQSNINRGLLLLRRVQRVTAKKHTIPSALTPQEVPLQLLLMLSTT